METLTLWYNISSLILGIVLFFPVRSMILGISVNRFRRKERREIEEAELGRLKKRVTVYSALIAMFFAFAYNQVLVHRLFIGSGG